MRPHYGTLFLLIFALAGSMQLANALEPERANVAVSDATGPHTVKSIETLVLHDAARNKDLPLWINYPDAEGPFPVIIFSHGAWGSNNNYRALTDFWASHGYVTIQASHSDSFSLGARLGEAMALRDWQSRPADVSFIIDALADLPKQAPELAGKCDAQRIGVGGHSFGAHTSQLIGGAKAMTADGEKSFADARVRAVMLLSGQGPGEMLTERSWRECRGPMFVMSGSADGPTRTGRPAEWRKQPYELSPPGDKYLVWVEGLDHGFGGISGSRLNPRNRPNPEHVRYTKLATLAYWNAYLKDSAEAREWLTTNRLSELSDGEATVESK